MSDMKRNIYVQELAAAVISVVF